ncbi:KGG domain-containing protein [Ramlibacter sp. MAHUQ-53]|uniref:KGG domain-containing protein n=1 Tax=unclassified Ramlibacter TaxID=2617605 RepID=UPI00363B8223
MASNPGSSKGGSNRGFASMDPQRQREIASQGGRAAHEKGTAHEFSSEEAREAGRKGGQARSQNNRSTKSGGSR